jgi:hypothetical protein
MRKEINSQKGIEQLCLNVRTCGNFGILFVEIFRLVFFHGLVGLSFVDCVWFGFVLRMVVERMNVMFQVYVSSVTGKYQSLSRFVVGCKKMVEVFENVISKVLQREMREMCRLATFFVGFFIRSFMAMLIVISSSSK